MFQNEYEPDNPMQKIYESTCTGGCLCTMRESCSVCSNFTERYKQRELIKEIAKSQGYQLYSSRWASCGEIRYKIEMEEPKV